MKEDISENYFEVIYNNCYGGFTFSDEFIDAIFEKYPPDSEVGSRLFRNEKYSVFINKDETPNPELDHYYIIDSKRPYYHGYSKLNIISYFKDGKFNSDKVKKSDYVTKDDKTYYYTHSYLEGWRAVPEVIALGKEKEIFDKKTGFSLLRLARVPNGYSYHINEYDGQESVSHYINFRPVMKELLDYIDTKDESKLGEIAKKLVKKELTIYQVDF